MAKTWDYPGAFTISVEDEADLTDQHKVLSKTVRIELHTDTLEMFQATLLADSLLRAFAEVTYHRFMRKYHKRGGGIA